MDLVTGIIQPDIVIAQTRGYYDPDAGLEIDAMLKHGLYADLTGSGSESRQSLRRGSPDLHSGGRRDLGDHVRI